MGILEKNFKKKVVPYLTTGGPRPALWNQDILVAERDKYGANDVKPGLTGWAQINGRDELEIPVKAKLDGDYVRRMGLIMDVKVWVRVLVNGYQLANIDRVLVHARVGNGMIDRRGSRQYITSWKELNSYMLENNMINHIQYIRNMAAIRVFVYTPRNVKKLLYKAILRR